MNSFICTHLKRLPVQNWQQVRRASSCVGPLAGIKVLDLTRVLAGPFCTQILADYGADVIKIEQPGTGDDTRRWRTKAEKHIWRDDDQDMSLYFSAVNRNKRSVALDLKHPKGRGILLQLAKQADVVIDNFIPGKMDNLQIGYDVLSRVNPKIVHASISGYGQTGPYAKRAGYDLIAGAEAGLLHITGETDGRPLKPGLGLTDMCTGLYTHGAILAALRSRDVSGKGQAIDTSLFETQISLMSNVAMSWLNLGQESQRWGNGHPTIAPYDSFETKDAHIVVGAVNDRQYKKLCVLLGCDELADTDQYATNPDRVLHRESLMNELKTIFRTKTTEEWCAVFEGSGMPYGPINTIEKAFEHPQVRARNAVTTIEDSRVVNGYLKVLNPAVAFSGDDVGIRAAAPSLGQHTDQVLTEIGFSTLEIENFRIDRVIG